MCRRGGRRAGAGAPRKPGKKISVLVGLPPDLLSALEGMPASRAVLVELACREYYKIKKPDAIDFL